MKIDRDVELVEGLPMAFIRSINSVVVADLHLGYEGRMARGGVFIPKANLKRIIKDIGGAIDSTGADRIIVVGDIKNEFSDVAHEEFNELYEVIKFCRERHVALELVKGNHDNFIDRYKESMGFASHSGSALIGKYLFFHGDRLPQIGRAKPRMLISGHEHPSIGVLNPAGRIERLRCFLLGEYKGLRLMVLPAIGYFATGSEVNMTRNRPLSPILRSIDVGKMHAIAVGYGSTIDFGTIDELREAAYR